MTPTTPPPAQALRFRAQVSGHTIILDVTADRYRLLPRVEGRRDPIAPTGEPSAADLGLAPPQRSVWASARPRARMAAEALVCLRRVARCLARRPFADLVTMTSAQPVGRAPRAPIAAVLASYRCARPFFPQPCICRLDAPALCLLARRCGWPATLVFGARLEPFAAHCWVEVAGAVLGEPCEQIQAYTPLAAF